MKEKVNSAKLKGTVLYTVVSVLMVLIVFLMGTMALAAGFIFRILSKRGDHFKSRIISGVVAEVIMVIGYYVFESFLYGGISSLVNIPANAVQGVAGLVIGIVLMKGIEKSKIVK